MTQKINEIDCINEAWSILDNVTSKASLKIRRKKIRSARAYLNVALRKLK